MPSNSEQIERVYDFIGEVLTDDEIWALVKRATGKDLYAYWAPPSDPRRTKIKKTIEALQFEGNERWILTYVLVYAAAQEKLRQKQEKLGKRIVEAFPNTLIGLPQAETHVGKAIDCLHRVLNIPLPPPLKFELRQREGAFADLLQKIVELFAYKSLHECLLLLLFTLNRNENLLAGSSANVGPNLGSIARQIDTLCAQAPGLLSLLGNAAKNHGTWVTELTGLSVHLRSSSVSSEVGPTVDAIYRLVRPSLSRLNADIFEAVQHLSFDPLIGDDVPEEIEDSTEFSDLVQAVRDLTTTVLARTLKYKMWQEAENQMSLVASYFESSGDASDVAEDWFLLRSRVNWLAELEPNENWSEEAKRHTEEIDGEVFKERALDDAARMHFDALRRWFRGPFRRIDEELSQDCGSLRKMDRPLTNILSELKQ